MCHLGSPAVMLSPFQSNLSQIFPSLNCVILFSDLQVALCLITWSLPTFATLSHIILIPAHFISANGPPRTSLFYFFKFLFISWRLITSQHCSGFCHTLTRISHGVTCIPHPDAPSHLPLHPIPLGLPNAPAPSTCLMHPAWAGDLFHP